jgi:type I restriction enzyme S subunit
VSKEQNASGIGRRRFRPYPEYKDSGVEWLGKIPVHWDIVPLKRLCLRSALYGANEPAETYREQGVRFLRTTDISNSGDLVGDGVFVSTEVAAEYLLQTGDLLFSRSGTIGRAFLYDSARHGLCAYAGYLVRFVPGPKLLPVFGFYLAKSQQFEQWAEISTISSTIGNLNAQKYANMPCPVPPFPEQCTIASFLNRETAKIDALIEKKERLIELLQEKRTALITQAVTKGLDPTVPMKDSGIEWLGEIPTHWALVPLKSLTLARPGSIKTGPFGSQLLASDMAQEEIKVYNQRNVIAHDFTAGENYISMSKFRELASFEVFKNDILVTTRGTIGKSAIVPNGAERGILHPCLLRIQPDSDKIKIAYLALIIQESNLVINQLALASNATTIDVIYSDTIGRVLIPCPPMNEQSAIFEFLDGMTAKIDALKSSIQEAIASLREYRTALISAAVTGKIDVREA